MRAFKAVGGVPPFIRSASGCRLEDADGIRYIDYVGSWGPMILGHARAEVVEAVQAAAAQGTSFGAPTELEVLLAEKIRDFFPSMDKVRLVNSGTEATMSALRVARAFTGRSLIVKFDGCYHGHSDPLLVKAGSGVVTLGISGSPGVPREFAQSTISLPFGDLAKLERTFQEFAGKVAAVIVEPVAGNMGVVVPPASFLSGLIEQCERQGAVAIFDEVMTGFRVAPGGAQGRFNVSPPLTCLGKIVGGGLPIGVYGGASEIMDLVAPSGDVYQAGTLSGNPIAVTAGLTTLEILERESPHAALEERTGRFCDGLREAAQASGIDLQAVSCGSMFTAFFNDRPVQDFQDAARSDLDAFGRFFRAMLDRGIYWAPSQFEACFISTAHSDDDLNRTLDCAREAFASMVASP